MLYTRASILAVAVATLAAGAAHAQTAQPIATSPGPHDDLQATPVTAPTAAPQADSRVDEIIVVARRIAENQQDVPTSIQTIGAREIATRNIQSAGDLNGLAGNLTLHPISATNFATTLRGVTAGGLTNQTLDAGVSIYIDGVYLGRGFQAVSSITDLERIEVLRGAQGTLFGRNVTGGAVSFITKNPAKDFGVSIEGSVGIYAAQRGRITLNTGEWQGLSVRFTYVHNQHDGWVKNLSPGIVTTFSPSGQRTATGATTDFSSNPVTVVSQDSMGAENADTIAAAIHYEGIPGLTVDYKFDYSKNDFTQPALQIVGFSGFAPFFPVPGVITVAPTSQISNFPGRMSAAAEDFNGLNTIKTYGHNLTVQYALSADITIKNIASHRVNNSLSVTDLDGSNLFVNISPANPRGSPYMLSSQYAPRRQSQDSDELQLIGKTGRVEWILGGFYFREKTFEQPVAFAYLTLPADRDHVTTTADYGATTSYALGTARSLAGYAHATWHATDRLDLAGGLRYSDDRKFTQLLGSCFFPNPALGDPVAARSNVDKRFTYCSPHAANPANPNTIPGSTPGPRDSSKMNTYDSVDFDASVTYALGADVKAYGRLASGFQSGGFINFYDFLPEHMMSYELGLKSEFWDHRIRLNGDVFLSHRKDAQQANYYGPTVGSHIDNLTYNVRGFEAELTAVPVRGLTFGSSLGYTDADTPAGNRQPFAKWNLALSGQYEFPALSNGARVSLHFDGNYVSKVPSPLPIPTFPGTASVFGGTNDAAATVPAQWTVNGRFGITDIPMAGVKGHLSFWVKNLLNDKSVNFGTDFVTVVLETYKPPRTAGLDIGFDF